MKISELARGLEILRPHFEGRDGYHLQAEHDQLYVSATDTPLSEEEVTEMKALGWFQEDAEGGDPSDAATAPYAPEENWSAYT